MQDDLEQNVGPGPVDPLAAALLPVILHDLGNVTQLLTALRTLASLPGGAGALDERADDVASAGEELHDLGWLLAAVGSAQGADLLLERENPRGLAVTVHYVRKALRRAGHDLAPDAEPLPRLRGARGSGHEVPWAVGNLLWHAARASEAPLAWRWTRTDDAWVFEVEHASEELARLMSASCPAAELRRDADVTRLCIPVDALELP